MEEVLTRPSVETSLPNEFHTHCKLIREHLAQSKLGEAFEAAQELSKTMQDGPYTLWINHLNARFTKYQHEKDQKLVSKEYLDIQYNTIVFDFLQLLMNLDIHGTVKDNQEKIQHVELQVSHLNAKLSFNIEIAKERINKLGECWTAMYAFENKLFRITEEFFFCLKKSQKLPEETEELYKAFTYARNLENLYTLVENPEFSHLLETGTLEDRDYRKLLREMEVAFEDYDEADHTLEKNKFWLGKDIYREARKYHDCYPRILRQFKDKNFQACIDCLRHQRDAAGSIEKTVEAFQRTIF